MVTVTVTATVAVNAVAAAAAAAVAVFVTALACLYLHRAVAKPAESAPRAMQEHYVLLCQNKPKANPDKDNILAMVPKLHGAVPTHR